MKRIFVTGTDTGIGKTWVSTILIRLFREAGYHTGAYKPVCSGAEFAETADNHAAGTARWADADQLRAACLGDPFADGEPSDELICPQRFLAPLAPPEAARLENRTVSRELLRTGLRAWQSHADLVVVEGAGGFLSPLSETDTLADLATEFQAPIVIVAGNRLGVINHTLLTIEAVKQRGLKVAAVILNDLAPASEQTDLSVKTNLQILQHWVRDIPVFECHWMSRQLHPTVDTTEKAPVQTLLRILQF